jgi:hypothetical protein
MGFVIKKLKALVAVAAAVMLMIGVLACGSGSPSSSAPVTAASSARLSPSPSPSPSNSLAATFSDGTQVLVAGGAVDGGGGGWTEDLEVVAGPDGLSNVGSLQIQAAGSNSSSWEANGSPDFYYGYAAPGNGITNEPPLPSNATNEDVTPPAELAPGTSICIEEDFQNASSSSEDDNGPDEYNVTAALASGAEDTVTLPTDGSGPGDVCLFTG